MNKKLLSGVCALVLASAIASLAQQTASFTVAQSPFVTPDQPIFRNIAFFADIDSETYQKNFVSQVSPNHPDGTLKSPDELDAEATSNAIEGINWLLTDLNKFSEPELMIHYYLVGYNIRKTAEEDIYLQTDKTGDARAVGILREHMTDLYGPKVFGGVATRTIKNNGAYGGDRAIAVGSQFSTDGDGTYNYGWYARHHEVGHAYGAPHGHGSPYETSCMNSNRSSPYESGDVLHMYNRADRDIAWKKCTELDITDVASPPSQNLKPYAAYDDVLITDVAASTFIDLDIDVMANDHDVNGDRIRISKVDRVSRFGIPLSVTLNSAGRPVIRYMTEGIDLRLQAFDTFYYEITDENGLADRGRVIIDFGERPNLFPDPYFQKGDWSMRNVSIDRLEGNRLRMYAANLSGTANQDAELSYSMDLLGGDSYRLSFSTRDNPGNLSIHVNGEVYETAQYPGNAYQYAIEFSLPEGRRHLVKFTWSTIENQRSRIFETRLYPIRSRRADGTLGEKIKIDHVHKHVLRPGNYYECDYELDFSQNTSYSSGICIYEQSSDSEITRAELLRDTSGDVTWNTFHSHGNRVTSRRIGMPGSYCRIRIERLQDMIILYRSETPGSWKFVDVIKAATNNVVKIGHEMHNPQGFTDDALPRVAFTNPKSSMIDTSVTPQARFDFDRADELSSGRFSDSMGSGLELVANKENIESVDGVNAFKNAIRFDGTTYLDLSAPQQLETGNLTRYSMSFWFKPENLSPYALLSFTNEGDTKYAEKKIAVGYSGHLFITTPGWGFHTFHNPLRYSVNQWSHFLLTQDYIIDPESGSPRVTWTTYLNGDLMARSTFQKKDEELDLGNRTIQFRLGANRDGNQRFVGMIDRLEFHSSVVDPVSVKEGLFSNIDIDGDSLPDLWETTKSGGLGSLGSGDADRDGISDVKEFRIGTKAFTADTLPSESLSVRKMNDRAVLQFQSRLNRRHRIYYSEDMATWTEDPRIHIGDGRGMEIDYPAEFADKKRIFTRMRDEL